MVKDWHPKKKTINTEMGLVSICNLRIAPAFYTNPIDLCGLYGPFKVYFPQNKRTTLKILLLVCYCMSTLTTLIKAMEDYSKTAFKQ